MSREIISERHLFEAYEITFCDARRAVIVGIVSIAQVGVRSILAVAQEARHVRCLLIACLHPAVEISVRHRRQIVVASAEFRIQAHHIAKRISEEHIQVEILVRENIAQRACELRICGSFILQEVCVHAFLEIDVVGRHLALFVDHHRHPFIVDAHKRNAEECACRVAAFGETSAAHQRNHITAVEKFRNLCV